MTKCQQPEELQDSITCIIVLLLLAATTLHIVSVFGHPICLICILWKAVAMCVICEHPNL